MFTLKDRTCVFSGATGMVGRGAVRALTEAGMNVVMVTHNMNYAEEIVRTLGDTVPGKCIAFSNEGGDTAAYKKAVEMFGTFDVLIANSGSFAPVKPFEDITMDELSDKLNHQICSAFELVQKAIPYLERSRAGRVILMSSAGAQNGFEGENFCDSVARGGVLSMTYCLSRILAEKRITVNCIARSGMLNDQAVLKPENYDVETVKDQIPLGHIGTTEEFGAAVAYLASEEAGFLTGQVINLSGGIKIG